jgi:hypothetical protein
MNLFPDSENFPPLCDEEYAFFGTSQWRIDGVGRGIEVDVLIVVQNNGGPRGSNAPDDDGGPKFSSRGAWVGKCNPPVTGKIRHSTPHRDTPEHDSLNGVTFQSSQLVILDFVLVVESAMRHDIVKGRGDPGKRMSPGNISPMDCSMENLHNCGRKLMCDLRNISDGDRGSTFLH